MSKRYCEKCGKSLRNHLPHSRCYNCRRHKDYVPSQQRPNLTAIRYLSTPIRKMRFLDEMLHVRAHWCILVLPDDFGGTNDEGPSRGE